MFKLSIIVPAEGLQEDLDNTLLTVLENRPTRSQVIVPCPKSYQDPYDLSDEVTFVTSPSSDLGALINAGVAASKSDIIHILCRGTLARAGWTDAAMELFQQQSQVAAIAPAVLRTDQDHRLAAAGIRYGRGGVKRYVAAGQSLRAVTDKPVRVDGPLLQAAFIRRDVLTQMGGLSDAFGPFHIETDLAARLREMNHRCVHQPASHLVGDLAPPPCGFRAARRAEVLYWHHRRGQRRFAAHVLHGLHATFDVLRQLPRPSSLTAMLGRGCGCVQGMLGHTPARPTMSREEAETVSIRLEDVRREALAIEHAPAAGRYSRSA